MMPSRQFKNLGVLKHLELFHSKRAVWLATSIPLSIGTTPQIRLSVPRLSGISKIKHGENAMLEPGMHFLKRAPLRSQDHVSRV